MRIRLIALHRDYTGLDMGRRNPTADPGGAGGEPAAAPEHPGGRGEDERNLLRTIIDAVPDLIHMKDEHGRFCLANRAWLAARGFSRLEEVQGKTVFDVFPAAVAQRMQDEDERIMRSGEPVIDEETLVLLFGADRRPYQRWSVMSKVPMRDGEGRITGIVGVSRDVTARRRLERERGLAHAVARVLAESHSVRDAMPLLIRTICEAMDWVYGARWIWDDAHSNLRRAEWWSEREPEFDPSDRMLWLELGAQASGGLARRAWFDQRPTWIADIEQVDTFKRKASCSRLGWRSAFAFPITAEDERIGVIEFFGREVRDVDEGLLQVSGALAAQIGQFIRRKRAEEALADSEQELRAIFDNANVGIVVSGLDMRYLRVNDKFCAMVGYAREELLRMRIPDLNLESNMDVLRESRERRIVAADAESTTTEKQLVRRDGSLMWASIASSLVRAADGAPRYFVAIIQDISEAKRAEVALRESEEQFRRLAQYDSLTGLPNRSLFHDRLGHAIAQARRNHWTVAVLFLDVDHFKSVNDTFGHAAGDQLLKQIASRLSGCIRAEDTIGRLSGDEFAIVLGRLNTSADARTVARKVVEEMGRPFQLDSNTLHVSASVGISAFPGDTTDEGALLRNADHAMYRAKDLGRNNFQFYSPGAPQTAAG